MLPPQTTVVGIDEHTALVIDPHAGLAEVYGRGVVTIQRGDEEDQVARGQTIALRELGPFHLPDLTADLPPDLWAELDAAAAAGDADAQGLPAAPEPVLALVEERQAARARRDWAAADRLRQQLAGLGWQVQDTPEGPRLGRLEGHQSSSFSHL